MARVELTEIVIGEVALDPPRPSLAVSIESWLGPLVEIPVAILVVAEIIILFARVMARYGMCQPLIWSDELASILFLWLAMLGAAVPALALSFVIRAAVVEGIATATEVSTIGIVYGFVVGLLVYRRFDWRRLLPMLLETAALSGAILLIIGTATGMMAWGLTQSGFSRALASAMTGLPAARPPSSRSRSSRSQSSAACWRASRRSSCSGRCCFPLRGRSACTRCTMP